ncbi:MAG: GNAT family N-acetyltransferase [Cyclobacteriaceae bacterium]|jgi:ribosomal protein S18 acetylase RimI-like enzyme
MPIQIRQAVGSDLAAVRKVAIDSYVEKFAEFNTPENMEAFLTTTYSTEAFEQEFSEAGAKLLVACEGDQVVGFVRLRTSNEVEQKLGPSTIELQRLYIAPGMQGRSIGHQLMEEALRHAHSLQVEWMWLGVWEKNFGAQRFYARYGFERFGEHTFWMGDDPQVDWLLKKKLS